MMEWLAGALLAAFLLPLVAILIVTSVAVCRGIIKDMRDE